MIVERPVAAQESPATPTPRPIPSSPVAPPPPAVDPRPAPRPGRWEARHDLARLRAETERARVLVDFLARPVHAHGGAEPDPDIVSAYNLAVEAALLGVRRLALATAAG